MVRKKRRYVSLLVVCLSVSIMMRAIDTSSNSKHIPTIYLETADGELNHVHQSKGNSAVATITLVDSTSHVMYNGTCIIKGRGNSTWEQDKKSYNLKFNEPVNLMGSGGKAKGWCLLANSCDNSQIRNALCFYIAREVGILYTSNIDFVSLYINGEYKGLYNLATKHNYKDDRGGMVHAMFEITFDSFTKQHTIETEFGCKRLVHKAIDTFEKALYSGTANYEQLEELADMHSLARKCFVDIVCANSDPGRSQYFIIDRTGKISAICAWDYDYAMGRRTSHLYNTMFVKNPWYNALFQYAEFREELSTLLNQYSPIVQYAIHAYADSLCLTIECDWAKNNVRWKDAPIEPSGNTINNVHYDIGTFQGEKEYLCRFMEERLSFLDKYWNSPQQLCKMTIYILDDNNAKTSEYAYYYDKGDTLAFLPKLLYDGDNLELYTTDGTSIADVSVITHDMEFYGKIKGTNDTSGDATFKYFLPIAVAVFSLFLLWLIIKGIIIPIKEDQQ